MAAESSRITILVQLLGFSADALHAELERFCTPALACDETSNAAVGDPPASMKRSEKRYIPPSSDQLRLAIVGAPEEIGAWGYTAPLLLEESNSLDSDNNTSILSACDVQQADQSFLSFTATVQVPAASFDPLLRYRLVIVDEPLLCASASGYITPGASIVAVESMRSQPDTVTLVPMDGCSCSDDMNRGVDSIKGERKTTSTFGDGRSISDSSSSRSSGGDGITAGHWKALIDVRGRVMHFARSSKQFAFLSQLSRAKGASGVSKVGPLLSLTFYGNNPSVRYSRNFWLESLSQEARDAVLYLQKHGDDSDVCRSPRNTPLLPTSLIDVKEVYPVQSDDCCWCEGHLPTPAPMERQKNAVKQSTQRRYKRRPTSLPGVSNFSCTTETCSGSITASDSASSPWRNGRHELSHAASKKTLAGTLEDPVVTAAMHRGWCVEPLRMTDPIRPFTRGDDQLTMRVWHTTVNVSPLGGYGLQVETKMPVPIYANGNNIETTHEDVDINKEKSGSSCCNYSNSLHSSKTSLLPASDATVTTGCTAGRAAETPTDSNECRRKKKSNDNNNNNDREQFDESARTVVGVKWVKGLAFLQPSLFQHHTSGTAVVPVCFNITSSNGDTSYVQWRTLYVQYLFVFPFQEPNRNTLEVVRSLASLGRLATKKLVGHRGLGKTYTRSISGEQRQQDGYLFSSATAGSASPSHRTHRLMVKLAENSLESLNAAHRRGCDMVEFDVMLTQDRIPVIFHDPLIQLQARGKRGAGTYNGRVELPHSTAHGSTMELSKSPASMASSLTQQRQPVSPFLTSTPSDAAACERYRLYMQAPPNFSSVPIAMHQLTRRQLDVVITETFTHVKAGNTLRSLILRHWHNILRLYRSRQSQRNQSSRGSKPKSAEAEAETKDNESVVTGQPLQGEGDNNTSMNLQSRSDYMKLLRKHERIVSQQEDVTNRICTLQDLFEGTPATLRFDLEVKFPFQPIGDSNLFLQTDAFEINAFVDDILRVVFAYADQRQIVDGEGGQRAERPRDVIFSSFEPDVCLALKLKQSRFDVVFLCETNMCNDFKDYRCFGLVEGALQFSILMSLSGVSIHAFSLCRKEQKHFVSMNVERSLHEQQQQQQYGEHQEQSSAMKNINDSIASIPSSTSEEFAARHADLWASFDGTHGKTIVSFAHLHGQLVWTWGEPNNDEHFRYLQSRVMGVDAIITDNVPLWSAANVETNQLSLSS